MAYTRLTTLEYEALCALVPRGGSLSDLCRDLLSEAVIARMHAEDRAARHASAAAPVAASA